MKLSRTAFAILVAGIVIAASPGFSEAQMLEGQTAREALDEETLCGIGRLRRCDARPTIERGLFQTGLRPLFPDHLKCRGIDEHWAISYTQKRSRETYHGGIDMPVPFGTPMIAAAAGTVVGKYRGDNTFRGMEITLRHSPKDTGLPIWVYTQYAHFNEMPDQQVGQRVRMGEVLGPTGNLGKASSRSKRFGRERRPAIHFAVWFSTDPRYVDFHDRIIPVDGFWMDPNALFRKQVPFDEGVAGSGEEGCDFSDGG